LRVRELGSFLRHVLGRNDLLEHGVCNFMIAADGQQK